MLKEDYVLLGQIINTKCVLFGIFGVILFYLPGTKLLNEKEYHKVIPVIVSLVIIAALYVSMGYYDYIYDCNKMRTGDQSVLGGLKPSVEDNYIYSSSNPRLYDAAAHKSIYRLHLFIISPMLLWFVYKAYEMTKNKDFMVFGLILLTMPLYHGLKLLTA